MQSSVMGFCEQGNEPSVWTNNGEYPIQLVGSQFLKVACTPWSYLILIL
jgi:hypothetical protein